MAPSPAAVNRQKRVGLARTLALDPDVVLFDEPTSALDPITAEEIGKLILQLKEERKITGVVVTHDVHGAKLFADRLMLLHEGKIRIEGSFGDLKKSKDSLVVQFMREAA
jgi:phospholipid/cholesterol/gamma-HCH transport system ATP-binding protein